MGERLLQQIVMHFVGELQESEGNNAILVVTDPLAKVQYYILSTKTITAADFADAYINNIWQLYYLARHVSLNCDLPFDVKFTKQVNQKFNINLHFSTAYNRQTDGLSKLSF